MAEGPSSVQRDLLWMEAGMLERITLSVGKSQADRSVRACSRANSRFGARVRANAAWMILSSNGMICAAFGVSSLTA
jgi:hypothetical protein